MNELTIDKLMPSYESQLRAEGKSGKTISWYRYILKAFVTFLEKSNLSPSMSQLNPSVLRRYILHLTEKAIAWEDNPYIDADGRRLSPHTIQGHVRALKAFSSWLANEGYADSKALTGFSIPKVPDKVLPIFSQQQLAALFSTIDRTTPQGNRNYVIVLLLLDTGIRVSELVGLRIQDLNLDEGSIKVMGEGQKERYVPISNPTVREIRRYVNRSRPSPVQNNICNLFLTSEGLPLHVNAVQRIMRRLGLKAEIQGVRCSPHTLRHTFATMYLANGGNVYALQQMLGHRSLQTTQKYVHLANKDIKEQHSQFSPVLRLNMNKRR